MSAHLQDTHDSYQASSKWQQSKPTNGAGSSDSQSTRHDQADMRLQSEFDDQLDYPPPPAPEVPRGPPISYRQPLGEDLIVQQPARTFSQRAKGQMLATEALEDDRYWDDNEDLPSRFKTTQDGVGKDTGQNEAGAPFQNGLYRTEIKRKVEHGSTRRETALEPLDSPQSTPSTTRGYTRPLRHSADIAPLKLDLGSPAMRANSVRGSKDLSEAQRRKWAADRSPLQTLEVKLNDISKEEKRARVEEAEMLLREAKAGRGRRRTSKEVPADAKKSISNKEPSFSAKSTTPVSPRIAQDDSMRPRLQAGSQKLDTTFPSKQAGPETIEPLRVLENTSVAGNQLHAPAEPSPQLRIPRDRSQTHQAHSDHHGLSFEKPQKDSLRQMTDEDRVHDPRMVPVTARPPNMSGPQPGQTSKRVQGGVLRATSNPKAPIPYSIPSNITRAVSLQQYQPQPSFPEDRDTSRAGPMRESNSSHKAVLAEADVALGAAGATAATSIKHDTSRKLQKAPPGSINRASYSATGRLNPTDDGVAQISASVEAPRFSADTYSKDPKVEFYYKGMPKQVDVQRSNSQRAPESVQLGVEDSAITESSNNMNKPRRASVSFKVPFDKPRPVNEWKQAGTARLILSDLTLDVASESDQAWWEMNGSTKRRKSRGSSGNAQSSETYSQQEGTKKVQFKPPLYLKCGPLLRYRGMRIDRGEPKPGEASSSITRETWRGSVMIVTHDSLSSYEEVPTLRLFSQPRDLLPPPPDQVQGEDLAPEYVDPIAGLTKVSRRGQILYVKPVDHLEEGKDLSRVENDDGLFEASPSPLDNASHGSATPNKRTRGMDGESLGKYREVKGVRLHADIQRDVTFWRFNIEVELSDQQAHIAYRINYGPPVGFWVPAKGQTMNIMFHSCNGFSLSVNPDQFGGPDPLWRDVLNTHQTRPFHVMIGGGDQLYNDRVMVDTTHFAAWTHLRNPHEKHHAPFTDEMRDELESFYLDRYSMWFSQGLFGLANSQIPMVNIYDDHDIIDGFGSYPDDFQRAPVFMGVGNTAFKYYMLFQHQSVPEETQADESSWLLGAKPGPYIQQLSRSVFLKMGKSVAFLGLDCRTERERYSILTEDTYDLVLERCRREIEEGETKHLLVLLGVPIAYPRMVWLENILTSRAMAPVKALGRAGILKAGFLNRFDGGVEVLDDLDDHWTASGHKEERSLLIQYLQDLAAEKSVRITILGGDVHLGAVGQFYSDPKLQIPKDRDHRYIPNVISSAIVNTPPPEMLADTLNKRNKIHRFDPYTVEDMIPMFTHDVDGKKRNNKRLLPRRNWCSIREYHPGSTPPSTPPKSLTPSDQMSETEGRPPQTRRRFSFSREDTTPRKLLRRFSQRGAPPSSYRDDMNISSPIGTRRASHDGYFSNPTQPQTAPLPRTSFSMNNNDPAQPLTAPANRTSFNSTAAYNHRASIDALPSAPYPRPGILRRPTNLSEKAVKKGGPPSFATDSQGNLVTLVDDHIDLEGGLDITLNCEVNQGDPAGITTPYRLLVPALKYDGSSDSQKLDDPQASGGIQRKPTLLKKLGFGRTGDRSIADRQGQGNWGQASDTGSESPVEAQYNGPHGDVYYEGEKRSSGPGPTGLRRLFSGRKGRKQQEDRYSRDYEHDLSLPLPPAAKTPLVQTQAQDEFIGREFRTTPPQPQQQYQQQQQPTTPVATPTKRNSGGYGAPPIEPFPSQARGKAARIMGVDQGPSPAYSPRAPPPPLQHQQQEYNAQRSPTAGASLNQSQPLPPPTNPPLFPPSAEGDYDEYGAGGTRFYARSDLNPAPQSGRLDQGIKGGGGAAAARNGNGNGNVSGLGAVVRGYTGVEAYRERGRGGKLRKWF